MTNCPNCGAPYKLHSRVCEYCGAVREKSPGEIRMEQELEQTRTDVEQVKHEFLTLRLQAAQQTQYDNITFNIDNSNVISDSIIGVNNKATLHNSYGIDGEYEALKKSLDARYNDLKGRAASDTNQTGKLTETEYTDEQFKKDAFIICSATITGFGDRKMKFFNFLVGWHLLAELWFLAFCCGVPGLCFVLPSWGN